MGVERGRLAMTLDLLTDALVFTDRMRSAKSVVPIRNARCGLRACMDAIRGPCPAG